MASIGANLMPHRMRVAQLLWNANISSEYSHLDNPKLKKQLDDVLERGIPFMIVFGDEEVAKGVVKIKNIKAHTEVEVPMSDMVNTLLNDGCSVIPAGADLDFLQALK